jgi:hypothetical protein
MQGKYVKNKSQGISTLIMCYTLRPPPVSLLLRTLYIKSIGSIGFILFGPMLPGSCAKAKIDDQLKKGETEWGEKHMGIKKGLSLIWLTL